MQVTTMHHGGSLENNQNFFSLDSWIQTELPDSSVVKEEMEWVQSSQMKLRVSHIASACGSGLLGMYGTLRWFNLWTSLFSMGMISFFTFATWIGSFWYGDGMEWKKASGSCCMTLSLGMLGSGCGIGLGISSLVPSTTRLLVLCVSLPSFILGLGIVGYALYHMHSRPNCHQLRVYHLMEAITEGNLSDIKKLMKKVLLNLKKSSNESLIKITFQKGNMDSFVKYLMQSGADPRDLIKEILQETMGSKNFSKLHRILAILPEELKQDPSLEAQFDEILRQWPQLTNDLRHETFYELFKILGENNFLSTTRATIKKRILNNQNNLSKEQIKTYIKLIEKMGWIKPEDSINYPWLKEACSFK